jgi:hypothetical protein
VNDYPSDDELKKIEAWPPGGDFADLMEFAKSIWWMADWGWHQKGPIYKVSTGGWSGNEEIIGAMQKNFIFWSQCWRVHRTGGHFVFRIR